MGTIASVFKVSLCSSSQRVVVVQSLSCVQVCNPMDCSMPGFLVLHHLLELAQTHVQKSVMPSNHLILCRPLLLPSVFSQHQVFSKAFDCVDHKKTGKFLERWEYQITVPASCETWMQVKKQQLEPDMEQWIGSIASVDDISKGRNLGASLLNQ